MAELLLEPVPWARYHRIIPSRFPPVSVYEDTLDPADLEEAFWIESLTNDRLREQAGDLSRVPAEDRITGAGSTFVMAAFTHIGRESRFSDGAYGVFYAASSTEAAIRETVFHRERFHRLTRDPAMSLEMREVLGQPDAKKLFVDIRTIAPLHDPDLASYPVCQGFGAARRAEGHWGLLYRSVRSPSDECLAAFRPPAVKLPHQGSHYLYQWDGQSVVSVQRLEQVL